MGCQGSKGLKNKNPETFKRSRTLESVRNDKSVRIANYSGLDLLERDSTAAFLDWDDTLFPSSWLMTMRDISMKEGKGDLRLELDPEITILYTEIVSFLKEVTRFAHVFILTSGAYGHVEKCCRIAFPQLLPILDALQVTILYSRPSYGLEKVECVQEWKIAVFEKVLTPSFYRPLLPKQRRFYEKPDGWGSVLSYSDAWGDHEAIQEAVASWSPQCRVKLVKAREVEPSTGLRSGLAPTALAKELRTASSLLEHLARTDEDCTYDLDDPEDRERVRSHLGGQLADEAAMNSGEAHAPEVVKPIPARRNPRMEQLYLRC
jgi:hypothetical protein